MIGIDYTLHRRRAGLLRRRAMRVFTRRMATALRSTLTRAAQAWAEVASRAVPVRQASQ